MRHFAHHIGDYAAATAHLSMLEDAAYHRLLRLYYQNEGPLTSDENELMRRVRAVSRHEKNAVRSVLKEFFTLSSDGWHQSRADMEISNFKHLVEAGRKGGLKSRLPKASSKTEPTTTHEPLPITQEPIRERERASAPLAPTPKPGKRLPETWRPNDAGRAFAAERGVDPDATADAFADYWASANGPTSVKRDWDAAFRTWCRRDSSNPHGSLAKAAARPVRATRGNDAFFERLADIRTRSLNDEPVRE